MNAVVQLTVNQEIATVVLADRIHKNTFTNEFIHQLIDAFACIKENKQLKVVILQGYDNFFCCGGTQGELIKIHEGRGDFTDLHLHDLLLECEIPVIAAMQGHALGGGLAFGCFADVIILAKQCLYSTNFMKYGFTPGFGSTYIIPQRFGDALGREMLFSAKNYYGAEFKERGVSMTVVDKEDVIPTATALAEEFVNKPRLSLLLLKQCFSEPIKKALPAVISTELAMHSKTFGQPEVRARIIKEFGK